MKNTINFVFSCVYWNDMLWVAILNNFHHNNIFLKCKLLWSSYSHCVCFVSVPLSFFCCHVNKINVYIVVMCKSLNWGIIIYT